MSCIAINVASHCVFPIEAKLIELEITHDEKATNEEAPKPVSKESEVEVDANQGNGMIKVEKMDTENPRAPKNSFDNGHDHNTDTFAVYASPPPKKACFQPTQKRKVTFYILIMIT